MERATLYIQWPIEFKLQLYKLLHFLGVKMKIYRDIFHLDATIDTYLDLGVVGWCEGSG